MSITPAEPPTATAVRYDTPATYDTDRTYNDATAARLALTATQRPAATIT